MDELKRLKKDWEKNLKFPKLSKDEIYKLLHKKSSSIVKRIFVFSLIEFGFWTLLSFVIKDNEAQQRFDQYEMDHITLPLMVIGYAFLIYFFFMFYKNYKSISTTASSKGLMEQILKTRKTVKYYVIFNLLFLYISIVIAMFIELNNNPDVALLTAEFTASGDYYIFYGIMLVLTLLAMALLTVLLLGFYYLIYGILLEKLKKNYALINNFSSENNLKNLNPILIEFSDNLVKAGFIFSIFGGFLGAIIAIKLIKQKRKIGWIMLILEALSSILWIEVLS